MLAKLAFALAVFGALAAAPAAAGDGPLYVTQGGIGVVHGSTRFVPVPVSTANVTSLEAISTEDGSLRNTLDLVGRWGLPYTPAGTEGISRNGRTLILADTQSGFTSPSLFYVVDPARMKIRTPISLKGYFSYDALSPDGSKLYLIQFVQGASGDRSRYVVRAYDLRTNRLLPGRIADRTQKSWVMHGTAVTRATSRDGRWVYTLYWNPAGYPFVHALDTVRGVAHCVGIPLADQRGIYNLVLGLHGRRLSVHWRSGRPFLDVDTTTWRVTPAQRSGFPWWTIAFAAIPLAAIGAFVRLRRRRGAEELEQELAELLRTPERDVVV